MSTNEVARRIARLEQRGDEGTPTFTIRTDGPPMTVEEIDTFTISIDRATDTPLAVDEEDNR
jgi:hypothetical protein